MDAKSYSEARKVLRALDRSVTRYESVERLATKTKLSVRKTEEALDRLFHAGMAEPMPESNRQIWRSLI